MLITFIAIFIIFLVYYSHLIYQEIKPKNNFSIKENQNISISYEIKAIKITEDFFNETKEDSSSPVGNAIKKAQKKIYTHETSNNYDTSKQEYETITLFEAKVSDGKNVFALARN